MLSKGGPVCSLAHLLDRNAELAARDIPQTVHTVRLHVRSTSLARDTVCAIEQTHDLYDAHSVDSRRLSIRPNPDTSVAARYWVGVGVGVGFASLIDNGL